MLSRKDMGGNPLLDVYAPYISKIDAALADELSAYLDSEFQEPLRYSLYGGKRIRPLILLLSAECFGESDGNTLSAACAVEMLHTESIIHDDIIDNEELRRLRAPFHVKYGYDASILSGDFVLGMILAISSRLDNPRITGDLAKTAMLMSEGEMIETRLVESGDVALDDYIKTIQYKTATAFEAAAKIGAVMGRGTEGQVSAMTSYGRNMGIAYQIRDDLLDWKNEDKLFNILVKKSSDPRDIFDRMEDLLKLYSSRARDALEGVPPGEARTGLERLIGLAMLKV